MESTKQLTVLTIIIKKVGLVTGFLGHAPGTCLVALNFASVRAMMVMMLIAKVALRRYWIKR
jgi:hypothetical protein